MNKKIISIILVLALLFLMPVSALAASVPESLTNYNLDFFINYQGSYTSTVPLSSTVSLQSLLPYDSGLPAYVDTCLVYEDRVNLSTSSGFGKDYTYDGYITIPDFVPLTGYSIMVGSGSNLRSYKLPSTLTSGDVTWLYSLEAGTYPLILDVDIRLPDGTSLPYTQVGSSSSLVINLPKVYFSDQWGVTRSQISIDMTFRYLVMCRRSSGSSMSPNYDFAPYLVVPYANIFNTYPVTFNGYRYEGQLQSSDTTADIINKKQDEIAASQASQSAKEHQDTVNGFDNSKGNQTNDKLKDGMSAYESQEDKAHQDFDEKMDAYENPDVSDYASGVSFISSAVVMWWNALGMFKVILLVGFSLMIFNYISRFRGG